MLYTWLLKLGVHFFRKPKFKRWTILEDKKYKVIKAVEATNEEFPQSISDYLSTALFIPIDFSKVFWKDELDAFFSLHNVTAPKSDLPLLHREPSKKSKTDPWNYSGRAWFLYSNILAKSYGWTEKQIAKLKVEDALAYIQEILTDEQLEREFIYSLSELAYDYEKVTKKSKLRPMQRPYWMQPDITEVKEIKTPKVASKYIPVGVIKENKNAKETPKFKPL